MATVAYKEVLLMLTNIAFRSDRYGSSEIFVLDADGSGRIRLTDDGATCDSPAWSPFKQ